MAKDNAEQIEIAERLQLKWLKHMETLLDAGTISPTDGATLARVLLANGWNLDPARLPKGLRDKIPQLPAATDVDEEDERIVGRIAG